MEATDLSESTGAHAVSTGHGLRHALAALLLYVLVMPLVTVLIIGAVYSVITGSMQPMQHSPSLRAWGLMAGMAVGCVTTLGYVRERWRPVWRQRDLPGLGFARAGAGQILAGVGLGLLAQVAGIALVRWLGPPHLHPQVIMLQLLHMNHALWWLAVPLTALLVPITEETLFRGALFSAARRHMSTPIAALLVTTVFVLAHLPGVHWHAMHLFGIALAGIFAIWLRWRCGSIYPAIAVHVTFNALAMLGLLALAAHG